MTTHGFSLEEAAESDWNVEDHISSFPPTYILHGDNDHACDFINSRILADALQNAGIPYEFEIGHGMDHGFGEALFSELRPWTVHNGRGGVFVFKVLFFLWVIQIVQKYLHRRRDC